MFENDSFTPIVINREGESIRPNNLGMDDTKGFFREQFHDVCGHAVFIRRVSETHQVIFCDGCGLRVHFPANIQTYGELRAYFEKAL